MEAKIHLLLLAVILPFVSVINGTDDFGAITTTEPIELFEPDSTRMPHLQSDQSAISLLKYLRQLDDKYHVDKHEDIVVVINTANNGQSFYNSLIAGAEAEKVIQGSIIPNSMVDCGTVFGPACYVIPGFNDGQLELFRTYVLRKVLNSARSVKFLITIPFESFFIPQHFTAVIRNFIDMMRDLQKYLDGIALVATDVRPISSDATEEIANLLKDIRSNLTGNHSSEDLHTLLSGFVNDPRKIGIIRRMTSLTSMQQLRNDQSAILHMVNMKLVYVQQSDDDFIFPASQENVNQTLDMLKELHNEMISEFNTICSDIKRFTLRQENANAKNLTKITQTFGKMYFHFISPHFSWSIDEPKVFAKEFLDHMNASEIISPHVNVGKFIQSLGILDFAQNLLKHNSQRYEMPTILYEIREQLKKLASDLRYSFDFYKTLSIYGDRLSSYEYNMLTAHFDASRLMKLVINNDKIPIEIADLEIKYPLAELDQRLYNKIQHMPVNNNRLRLLQSVWGQNTLRHTIKCSEDGKHLTVYGYNVALYFAQMVQCWHTATSVEIFALNNLYIDDDIENKNLSYLAIIAPEWKVYLLNDETSRKIHLNGSYSAGLMLGIGNKMIQEEIEIRLTDEDGANGVGMQKTTVQKRTKFTVGWTKNANKFTSATHFSKLCIKSLTKYHYFAREHLAANLAISNLDQFINDLNENNEIYSLYDVISLFNEFESTERHYLKLHKSLSFIPYYESLRDHIITHYKTMANNTEERKALSHLFAAVSSRLFAIKRHEDDVAVVDLLVHMDGIKKKLTKLLAMQKTKYIEEYRDEFKQTLDNKIETAAKLINTVVAPAINKTYSDVDHRIKQLLNETFEKERVTKEYIWKAEVNIKALQEQAVRHQALSAMKMIAALAAAAGPFGMLFGAIVGFGANLLESATDSQIKLHTITLDSSIQAKKILHIREMAKGNIKLLKAKLEDLQKIFQNENVSNFEPILKRINETLIKVNEAIDKQEIPSANLLESFTKSQQELSDLIGAVHEDIKDTPKYKSLAKKLDHASLVIGFAGTGLEFYQTVHNDQQKMEAADQMLGNVKNQLQILKVHEQNIYNVMIPQAKMMEQSLNEAMKNAKGKIHVELDISKWTLQSALKDTKKLFNDMTQGFEVAEDLERCVEKLHEAMTTLIDVYDRIDSYSDKSQLATLISDIAIGSVEFQDPTLKKAVFNIEKVINTNLAMQQYELALRALKQHKFPFAEMYLKSFQLPINLNTSDANFVSNAIDQIDNLIDGIRESNAIISQGDMLGYQVSNEVFVDSMAFYKWDNKKYKKEIAQLLNGEAATLVSNLNSGLEMYAVKFNLIWLKFRLINETLQDEFDEEFKNFDRVRMEIAGNNFYRCNNRIYYIPLEKPFDISFSPKCMPPCSIDGHHANLWKSKPFLSPYTTWNVILVPDQHPGKSEHDFAKLSRFQDYVTEVALEGHGDYVHRDLSLEFDICSDRLDNYYRFDRILHTPYE